MSSRACGLLLLLLAGFSLLPPGREGVNGSVTADGAPLAAAVVRYQGRQPAVHSDQRGRFRLPLLTIDRPLTAAKEGYLIGVAQPRQPHFQLEPVPAYDHDDYAWIDPTPDLSQSNNCGNCHEPIYKEWSGSAHGRSVKNQRFLNLFAGGGPRPLATWNLLEEYPLGSGVCATCHAPTLESPVLDYDIRAARGVATHGVHCDFCHKIAEAPTDKLGTRFGRDGYRLRRPPPGELLVFGPLDDAVRPGEQFAYAPFYRESRYCASCHEGVIFGVHVYGTYTEWLESPAGRAGQHCQDCHMAPTGAMANVAPGHGGVERDPRTLSSHAMVGATPEMLRRCVNMTIQATRGSGAVVVHVELLADHVGHRVPTGFIDRHLILHVAARQANGGEAALVDGGILPPRAGVTLADQPGRIFGKQHLDAAGTPLPFWRVADQLLDTRLHPGRKERYTFVFADSAEEIRVRLVYRRFWAEVAQARDWHDNEILINELVCRP